MRFTNSFWHEITPIYQLILQHPFIQELQQGSLAKTTFTYYLQQDVLYLTDYARALALTAVKAQDNNLFLDCLAFAKDAILAETSLHHTLLHTATPALVPKKSLSCLAYTQFLLATTSHRSFAESMAALLPCFWIYREVGNYLLANTDDRNPYHPWIETYSGNAFDISTAKAINITEMAAAQASTEISHSMRDLFTTAAQLELAFWDEAYHFHS